MAGIPNTETGMFNRVILKGASRGKECLLPARYLILNALTEVSFPQKIIF
jgi:hypothetical protein